MFSRTTGAGVPLNRSLIDHDGESKTGMAFRRRHHQLRRLVDGIALAVPVNDCAIDAAAGHVVNLTLHLSWVRLAVAVVHVARLAEPKNHVSVDFCGRARIQQRVNVYFAHVPCAFIVVCLFCEAVRGAGIVTGLRCQSSGWHYVGGAR